MPRQVYIPGFGFVRAGSWATKGPYDQWELTMKQLDQAQVIVPRLEYLLFQEGSEISRLMREVYEGTAISQLENLRDQINDLLNKFPKMRRAEALENVTGRTPEEAAAFREKAQRLRES